MVYVNTLMLQDVLAEDEWSQLLTSEDYRGRTPLTWANVAMHGEFKLNMNSRLDLGAHTLVNVCQDFRFDAGFVHQPLAQHLERIMLTPPPGFLILCAIVAALDVANMVTVEAISVAKQEGRAFTTPRTRHQIQHGSMHSAYILPIYFDGVQAKRAPARG